MIRNYIDLLRYDTLEDRFEYLRLDGMVGESTFGSMRGENQSFYHSREWRDVRSEVIARDQGLDLGVLDCYIAGPPAVHHMNPITLEDIYLGSDNLLHPDFLISVSHATHNAIHYGDKRLLPRPFVERTPGDTQLW